jgi:ABC-2 type transport system permease protein
VLPWWDGFLAIANKELTHAFRNKAMLKTLVLSQCLNLGVLAWIDLTVRELPTVIVDQDRSEQSRELVQLIGATGTFKIKYLTSSTDQARSHIRAGRAKVAVVIPPDYARLRTSLGNARVLALVDGSDAASSAQAAASLEGVAAHVNVQTQREAVATAPRVTAHAVLLFNPQGRTSSFMLPALLAVLLAEFYTGLGMMSLGRERQGGNLERLVMTPMSLTGLILGKLAPWFGIGVVNAIVYLLVSRFLFGVPIRGGVPVLLASTMLYVLTCVAIGSFLAAGAKGPGDAQSKLFFFYYPVIWFSGYIFPLSSLPKVFLPVAYALPQTHFIEIIRGICLRGATASDLWPHLAYFTLAPIVLTAWSVRRFSRSIMQ